MRFEDFLDNAKWLPLKDHLISFNQKLEVNIDVAIQNDKSKEIRKALIDKYKYEIKKEDLSIQEILKKELVTGNVVAVDGTCTDYDLLLGFQARIGIVATNYKNARNEYTVYISDPFIAYDKNEIDDVLEYAKQKGQGRVGISSAHIRAIMLYKEREFVLERKEKYKMVQGDILPYELKNGQGRLRGLRSCLELGRRLINDENIIAVQTKTTDPLLRLVGQALLPGEYIVLRDYADDLNAFLEGEGNKAKEANFSNEDGQTFKLFVQDAINKFSVGVYKASNRAYVFYAPSKNISEMINLVFVDSKFQPLRGFPLLLDYADTLCSHLLPSEDFTNQIESKLAKKQKLDYEIPERQLRRK